MFLHFQNHFPVFFFCFFFFGGVIMPVFPELLNEHFDIFLSPSQRYLPCERSLCSILDHVIAVFPNSR